MLSFNSPVPEPKISGPFIDFLTYKGIMRVRVDAIQSCWDSTFIDPSGERRRRTVITIEGRRDYDCVHTIHQVNAALDRYYGEPLDLNAEYDLHVANVEALRSIHEPLAS